jgi:hypothetical protein
MRCGSCAATATTTTSNQRHEPEKKKNKQVCLRMLVLSESKTAATTRVKKVATTKCKK